jgi:methylenetetrahydrofolate dehydrogenase (NADP+)/methenyltetrahydrofolate cyclohydrolase
VTNKVRSCGEAGFQSTLIQRPSEISQQALMDIIQDLNNDPEIDGFIVQLPLPEHMNEMDITLAIKPEKDVDGFHPMNMDDDPWTSAYLPATPMGIMQMLERYKIDISGKQCCVIGRSNIVGTPISILLSRRAVPEMVQWYCVTAGPRTSKKLQRKVIY